MTIYYQKAYKEICKINPDLIISERDYDVINQKLVKRFGKEKLAVSLNDFDFPAYLSGYLNK